MIRESAPNDDVDPTLVDDDTDAVTVNGFDVRHVVFIIPLGAPLPNEANAADVPTGSLYQRIAALDLVEWSDDEEFRFVPVSGAELLALERVWRLLTRTKKVVTLMDIPAARYDVLFTQAARQIGLPSIDWPGIADALAERALVRQRTRDGSPWKTPIEVPPVRRSKLPQITGADTPGDFEPHYDESDTV